MSSIGAVVLAYGDEEVHRPLLVELAAAGVAPGRVVIVHNPAGSREPALPVPAGSTVLEMERNSGYAGGMNAGIRRHLEGGCTHVVLLTQDARFHSDGLSRLLAATDAGFGIVGPALRWDATITCYGGVVEMDGRVRFRQSPPAALPRVAECDWVDGSALLVDARVFQDVGLFDERFFMYFEEVELCWRAAAAGWGIGVLQESVAEQDHGYLRRPALYAYLMTRNGLEFARRAAGRRGVASVLAAAATGTPRSQLAPMLCGVAAFGLRRFGPPPPSLLQPVARGPLPESNRPPGWWRGWARRS